MVVSFAIALYFQFIHPVTGLTPIPSHWQLVIGVGVTTAAWLTVTLLTKPVETEKLRSFYRLVHPGGPGWKKVIAEADAEGVSLVSDDKRGWDVPTGILCILLGAFSIYFSLFATGYYIYGKYIPAISLTVGAAITIFLLTRAWGKLRMN